MLYCAMFKDSEGCLMADRHEKVIPYKFRGENYDGIIIFKNPFALVYVEICPTFTKK